MLSLDLVKVKSYASDHISIVVCKKTGCVLNSPLSLYDMLTEISESSFAEIVKPVQRVCNEHCDERPTSNRDIGILEKTEWWGAGVVICLERGADLHMAQLMPLPLTISCSSKIQIGFTFLVPAHLGSPGQRAVKRVCVYIRKLKGDVSGRTEPVSSPWWSRSCQCPQVLPARHQT